MSDVILVTVPAEDFPFEQLCKLLEDLYKINNSRIKSKMNKQTEVLKQFIEEFRISAAKTPGEKDRTFYPILRLLLPELDRMRSAYNIREARLGQILVDVLSLHKQSKSAQKLLNFKAVGKNKHGSDLPGVAYFSVLKNRPNTINGLLTINDINIALDKIAEGGIHMLNQVFVSIMKRATAIQQKWFLRILLKDLKIGIGKERILTAYHHGALRCYNMYNCLFEVCSKLDESNNPDRMGVQVFFAISPMLSKRLDVKNANKLPKDTDYLIETKFDGERFQIHMKDGKFEYFSRRGFTYSKQFGADYSSGNLTPFLKDCFDSNVKSFILDGEMMGWHKEQERFSSKGIAFDVKTITEKSSYRPCFCAFDILYYNGTTLVGPAGNNGMPLKERLELLDKMFHDKTGVICHSKRVNINNSSMIAEALNRSNEQGEEGIVVKNLNSYYLPASRDGGWYKVKSEYSEGAMEDMDLLIIGGNYGQNKKQGKVATFVVALADSDVPGETPSRWISIGCVSTGLSNEQREQLCAKLGPHWKTFKDDTPDCLLIPKKKPDFWIQPENSILLEIRATELVESKEFATGYTLRFPRIVKIREDKPIKDAMTLEQLNEMVKDKPSVIKLNKNNIDMRSLRSAPSTSRTRKRPAKPLEVAEQFKSKKSREVAPESKLLEGKEVCILSHDYLHSKNELERIVLSHGGIVVQNFSNETFCCVYGDKNAYVKATSKLRNFNVVHLRWLLGLANSNDPSKINPRPIDMLSRNDAMREIHKKYYDQYGDHYTTPIGHSDLKELLNKMDETQLRIYLNTDEMLQMDEELFANDNKYSYLRGCFIHFPEAGHRLGLRARMYGAKLCDLTSPNLSHVIVKNASEKCDICENKSYDNVLFVTEGWLEESFNRKTYAAEDNYIV